MLRKIILIVFVFVFIGCTNAPTVNKSFQEKEISNNLIQDKRIQKKETIKPNNNHYISISKKNIFLKSFDRRYKASYSTQKYNTYLTDKYLILMTDEISGSKSYLKHILVKLINLNTYEEKNIRIAAECCYQNTFLSSSKKYLLFISAFKFISLDLENFKVSVSNDFKELGIKSPSKVNSRMAKIKSFKEKFAQFYNINEEEFLYKTPEYSPDYYIFKYSDMSLQKTFKKYDLPSLDEKHEVSHIKITNDNSVNIQLNNQEFILDNLKTKINNIEISPNQKYLLIATEDIINIYDYEFIKQSSFLYNNPFLEIQNQVNENIKSFLSNANQKSNFEKSQFETKEMFNKRIQSIINQYKVESDLRLKNLDLQKLKFTKEALNTVFIQPSLKDLTYDAENQKMFATLYFKTNNFTKKIEVDVPIAIAKEYYENLSNVEPEIIFELKDNDIILSKIQTHYKNSLYKARISEKDYKPEVIKLAIKKVNYESQLTDTGARVFAYYEDEGQGFVDDIPNLIQNYKAVKEINRNWLISIGIEDYENTDDIKFSKRSTENFVKVAQKTFGISERNSYTFIDSKATSGAIKDNLAMLLKNVKKGDTIYFYYSGHGIPVLPDNEPYILPKDKIPEMISKDKFFKLSNIYKLLSDSKATKVVAFVDSCFSGATDGKSVIKGVAASRLVPKKVSFDKSKMVVLTAGKDKQYSNMYEEKGHRLFSYFLMKSLLKGKTNIDDIYKEVYTNVKDESYKMGDMKIQEPTIEGNKKLQL
jgi:hypothetical protein